MEQTCWEVEQRQKEAVRLEQHCEERLAAHERSVPNSSQKSLKKGEASGIHSGSCSPGVTLFSPRASSLSHMISDDFRSSVSVGRGVNIYEVLFYHIQKVGEGSRVSGS